MNSSPNGDGARGSAPKRPRQRRPGRPPASELPQQPRDWQILEAAIGVFAEKGFHAAKISDIAQEAGVAYGLVYHYFSSKEEILEHIVERTWSRISEGIRRIEQQGGTAAEQLANVVRLMLASYRAEPALVRVFILEFSRSPKLRTRVHNIARTFDLIENVVESGQASGEFRDDISPQLAIHIFWGGLDEVLTGWVIGTLDDTPDDISAAETALIGMLLQGLRPPREFA